MIGRLRVVFLLRTSVPRCHRAPPVAGARHPVSSAAGTRVRARRRPVPSAVSSIVLPPLWRDAASAIVPSRRIGCSSIQFHCVLSVLLHCSAMDGQMFWFAAGHRARGGRRRKKRVGGGAREEAGRQEMTSGGAGRMAATARHGVMGVARRG
jgi:hypothetical protein